MYMKCCNPDCNATFNYREGRLVRVSKAPPKGNSSEMRSLVEHFWLCGKCAKHYVLEHEYGMPVKVRLRETPSVRAEDYKVFSAA
jgi:hypothetical protein